MQEGCGNNVWEGDHQEPWRSGGPRIARKFLFSQILSYFYQLMLIIETLAGLADQHDEFWAKLTSVVDIEPPKPIYRILGRNHVVTQLPQTASWKMRGIPIPKWFGFWYATPFPPEGSISQDDEETKGELAPNACKVLMKALWLGRLARPDIVKPINGLATKVRSWSRGDDKRVLRLIQHILRHPTAD